MYMLKKKKKSVHILIKKFIKLLLCYILLDSPEAINFFLYCSKTNILTNNFPSPTPM